ncbi:MAG: hypothetical protein ACFFER_17760 [Candidatus Thorarchaeota archaeon]
MRAITLLKHPKGTWICEGKITSRTLPDEAAQYQITPLNFSGFLAIGVYEDCRDSFKSSGNYQIEVIAQALLQPPTMQR